MTDRIDGIISFLEEVRRIRDFLRKHVENHDCVVSECIYDDTLTMTIKLREHTGNFHRVFLEVETSYYVTSDKCRIVCVIDNDGVRVTAASGMTTDEGVFRNFLKYVAPAITEYCHEKLRHSDVLQLELPVV